MEKIARRKFRATEADIAKVYKNALESVAAINEVISHGEKDEEDIMRINQGVGYLELIKLYKKEDDSSFWTSEDFTAIDKAITDGKAYVA